MKKPIVALIFSSLLLLALPLSADNGKKKDKQDKYIPAEASAEHQQKQKKMKHDDEDEHHEKKSGKAKSSDNEDEHHDKKHKKMKGHDDDDQGMHEGKGKDKAKKMKQLPPGLEMNLQRGKSLPPGWEKKLARGEVLDQEILDQAIPVSTRDIPYLPANNAGEVTVKLDNKYVRLISNTREIVDIVNEITD